MAESCAYHPMDAALTVCSSCRRGLCALCWRRNVAKQPWCELCVHHLSATGNQSALAVVFFMLGAGVGAWLWQRNVFMQVRPTWVFWLVYAAGVCWITVALARRRPRALALEIELRGEGEPPGVEPMAKVGRPYRAALLHASHLVASPVSGVWTTVLLLGCMLTAATALPWLLHLPKWLEAEAVIGLWWGLWCGILTVLLYRGWRLADDHVLASPSTAFRPLKMVGKAVDTVGEPSGCGEAASCGEQVELAVLLVGLLAIAWVVVELAAPGLFFCAYLLVRTSLARVANDRHGCEQRLGRALAWGAFWSSVVALPLAAVLLLAHQLWRPLHAGAEGGAGADRNRNLPGAVTAPAAAPEP